MTVVTNDTTNPTMPSASWFAALEEDRKTRAIKGSYLWKLAHDQDKLWDTLGPYADRSEDLMIFRNYLTEGWKGSTSDGQPTDTLIAEMLEQVPDTLIGPFILFALSTHLDSLGEIAKLGRKYAPEVTAEIAKEHTQLGRYVSGDLQDRRTMAGRDQAIPAAKHDGHLKRLWVALADARMADPKVAGEVDKAWRLNARAKYILGEVLRATAGDY
jgi:hypothetical protein